MLWLFGWFECALGILVYPFTDCKVDHEALFTDCGLMRHHHYACTSDGYILNLQRISKLPVSTHGKTHTTTDANVSGTTWQPQRILLIHGFLQDSDSFICPGERSIVHNLAHAVDSSSGLPKYEVWLGNNRGNRYSHGHTSLRHGGGGDGSCACHSSGFSNSEHEDQYWNYCIDDLAGSDVPCMIEYVSSFSTGSGSDGNGQRSSTVDCGDGGGGQVVVIGFSQGSTQVFGFLSAVPSGSDSDSCGGSRLTFEAGIRERVALFVALAPAVQIPHIGDTTNVLTSFVHALISIHPTAIFRALFGSKCVLGFTRWVQERWPARLYTWFVRVVMHVAFGWDCRCISLVRQLELFRYCYSFGSVKCVHHWYQISENRTLCGFRLDNLDHVAEKKGTEGEMLSGQGVCEYDLGRIVCPVALFIGEKDSVIDPSGFVHKCSDPHYADKSLPPLLLPNAKLVDVVLLSGYEHLDLIWADDVLQRVNEPLMTIIDQHTYSNINSNTCGEIRKEHVIEKGEIRKNNLGSMYNLNI